MSAHREEPEASKSIDNSHATDVKETKKRIKPVIEEIVGTESAFSSQENSNTQTSEKVEENEIGSLKQSSERKIEHPSSGSSKVENRISFGLIVVITLVSALVAAIVSGGVYVYLSGLEYLNKKQEEPEPITTSPTPVPTPVNQQPKQEPIDLSQYSVQVLNGSGMIGAAKSGEKILIQAGFKVNSTGNAANYNFKSTVVEAKDSVLPEVLSKAKDALEKVGYKVEIGKKLNENYQYDIVVTMGPN